jgi:hypothetical protein
MELKITKERIVQWIFKKLLMGVVNNVKKRPMDQERMKGLTNVN